MIKSMNNTKTIAAPETPVLHPVLHINHSSFLSFHSILWFFSKGVHALRKNIVISLNFCYDNICTHVHGRRHI